VSNIISADHDPVAEDVVMSNGMTSVFLSVLLLSGSDLARSDHEVATVAWLAEQDQATVGLGRLPPQPSHRRRRVLRPV
jgi:hypothetical protein